MRKEVNKAIAQGWQPYGPLAMTGFQSSSEQGDTVLVRQPKVNKLSTPFNPSPCIVKDRKGSMVTAVRADGSTITRNSSMFRPLPHTVPVRIQDEQVVLDEPVYEQPGLAQGSGAQDITNHDKEPTPTPASTPTQARRSQRISQKPRRLLEEI